uniref:Putative helicase n=1 Tax=Trypanosoma vivax (strain Y486) TaxID=1055687 RepID=G0U3K2_TRYVY|nr:putative helicase, fragment [Trypanosoma vivax Y486]
MYTLNSTSMRRPQEQQQQQHKASVGMRRECHVTAGNNLLAPAQRNVPRSTAIQSFAEGSSRVSEVVKPVGFDDDASRPLALPIACGEGFIGGRRMEVENAHVSQAPLGPQSRRSGMAMPLHTQIGSSIQQQRMEEELTQQRLKVEQELLKQRLVLAQQQLAPGQSLQNTQPRPSSVSLHGSSMAHVQYGSDARPTGSYRIRQAAAPNLVMPKAISGQSCDAFRQEDLSHEPKRLYSHQQGRPGITRLEDDAAPPNSRAPFNPIPKPSTRDAKKFWGSQPSSTRVPAAPVPIPVPSSPAPVPVPPMCVGAEKGVVLHLSKSEGGASDLVHKLALHQKGGYVDGSQGSQQVAEPEKTKAAVDVNPTSDAGGGAWRGRKNRSDRGRQDMHNRGPRGKHSATSVKPSNPVPLQCDEDVLREFKRLYAQQGECDGAEHLRSQAGTGAGVVGTLDVERCSEMIAAHDVTIVVTDTGTGKSTLIPKAILDSNPSAKVVNTQPRRTPAIKLAQRVSSLYGECVGTRVGYWVRGEHVGSIGCTPIMYVTNYTLFLHLLHTPPDDIGLTHVIFDEFHERTVEVEVLLLIIKLVMKRNPGKLKLILCSATAEASKWTGFFEDLTVAGYCKAEAMYKVHDYYLEDICKLIGASFVKPDIDPTGIVKSVQLHSIMIYIKAILKFLAATAAPEHSILLFVPGRTVVEQLSEWIRDNLGDQLDPIPWYRDIELSFIQEAIERESVTRKKVYVATDIAEVSITLPDVVFVIDSGTGKRPHIVESNLNSVMFPPLELLWESPVNLVQRRGRIGRVQQGFFFTMLSRDQVDQLPQGNSRLGNAVMHEVVLHCLHLTSAPFPLFSMCPEEPRRISVQLSLSTLSDGGYIVQEGDSTTIVENIDDPRHLRRKEEWGELITDAYSEWIRNKGEGAQQTASSLAHLRFNLTMRGLIVGSLPFDVESGTIVFHGLITGLTTLAIIAASCVSCKTVFYVPYNVSDRLERLKLLGHVEGIMRRYKGEFLNDAVTAVGVVIEYMAMQRDGLSEEGQKAWCDERYVSRSRIVDILLVMEQTREQLASIIPYEYVSDLDELMDQYNANTQTLSLICAASYMHHGIYVLHDAKTAEKERFAGPFALHTIYGRLAGSFALQLRQEIFNTMLLAFSSRIVYEEFNQDVADVTFEVTQGGSCVYIKCDTITALQLLQLRRLICAQLCVLHLLLQRETEPGDATVIAEHLQKQDTDFGIPPALDEQPQLLPVMITTSLAKIVQRIESAKEATGTSDTEEKINPPCCRAVMPPENFYPTRQSALVFSSNGCDAYRRPTCDMLPSVQRNLSAEHSAQ